MLATFFTLASTLVLNLAGGKPATVWTLAEQTSAPESAYFDPESKRTFVSNVAGGAADKDGTGWIAEVRIGADGRAHATKLVDGLNAPKGLRASHGTLWATDIDELIAIDLASGTIRKRIAVPGATFLNDPAIADDGRVFAADTIASRIYVVDPETGASQVFLAGEDLESPNGLLIQGDKLFVTGWGFITDPATFGAKVPGHLYAIDLKTKEKTLVTKAPLGNLDGLERAANGDFLVSDYAAGKVFRVDAATGEPTLIVEGLKNAADIGLDGDTLLIPDMGANAVYAVKL